MEGQYFVCCESLGDTLRTVYMDGYLSPGKYFGVHRVAEWEPTPWSLTHVGTGLRAARFETEERARAVAERLEECSSLWNFGTPGKYPKKGTKVYARRVKALQQAMDQNPAPPTIEPDNARHE